ncbi:flagellar basal body rod C-terminal domain-containing protein [Vibrio vulnificus]|nr:hypothetical protein [Vibrio vulnificus]ELI3521925.1 hypothetical protein [Vibrio vulnificus]
MALSEIKAIAAQGLIRQRMIVESAGLNIANANKVYSKGQTAHIYRVKEMSQPFSQLIEGEKLDTSEIVALDVALKPHLSPNDPAADSQGMIWKADIDTTQELIDVVRANRAYEANLRVYNTASSMGKTIMKLGSE